MYTKKELKQVADSLDLTYAKFTYLSGFTGAITGFLIAFTIILVITKMNYKD